MATSKGSAKKGSSKAGGQGLMKKVQPSADLAEVIGSEAIPRTEVTKRVWDYIKKHKLQDEKNRRMINADAKLLKVFGNKKQVSMFEMTKLISNHLK